VKEGELTEIRKERKKKKKKKKREGGDRERALC